MDLLSAAKRRAPRWARALAALTKRLAEAEPDRRDEALRVLRALLEPTSGDALMRLVRPMLAPSVSAALERPLAPLLAHERLEQSLPLLDALSRALSEEPSPAERFVLAERLAGAVAPGLHFSEFGRRFLEDEEFTRIYVRFMDPGNWHSYDRKYLLDQLLLFALEVPGDLAECGTYKGASAHLMCRRAAGARRVHLFDSFEGLSTPQAVDGDYWKRGSLETGEEPVRAALAGFVGWEVYKGWIPDRFPEVADRAFCFVHVDVDLYEPTRDSVAFFYPRLSPGGVMLFDDYGFTSCPGARKAVDEYFAGKETVVDLPTGQALVIRRAR